MSEYTKTETAIRECLRERGPMTVRQLVYIIYGKYNPKYASCRNAVNFAIKRMFDRGTVLKDGYGPHGAITYRLAETDNDGEDEVKQ